MTARLQKEYRDIISSPPIGVTAGLAKDNLNHWIATLAGPDGTPYAGAIFTLDIVFPKNYPFKPPTVTFVTPIYHCNINSRGDICLDILKSAWTPSLTVDKVLLSISSLLAEPNPNDPLVPDIATLYKNDRYEHDRLAREHTMKHAINK